jgi:hypothetical protein
MVEHAKKGKRSQSSAYKACNSDDLLTNDKVLILKRFSHKQNLFSVRAVCNFVLFTLIMEKEALAKQTAVLEELLKVMRENTQNQNLLVQKMDDMKRKADEEPYTSQGMSNICSIGLNTITSALNKQHQGRSSKKAYRKQAMEFSESADFKHSVYGLLCNASKTIIKLIVGSSWNSIIQPTECISSQCIKYKTLMYFIVIEGLLDKIKNGLDVKSLNGETLFENGKAKFLSDEFQKLDKLKYKYH